MARYKVTKEQVEKLVETFVTEAAAPEAKKHVKVSAPQEKHGHSVKTNDGRTGKKQSPEAKKHIQGSEKQDEENGQKVKEVEPGKKKMKQPKEAKKYIKNK